MVREISAGGVVVRKQDGAWWMAAIELPVEAAAGPDALEPDPENAAKATPRANRAVKPKTTGVRCFPKGLVAPGEKALDAALREVHEETGVTAALVTKLADIRYVYVRTWGDGERVFKIVSFYLLRYESGEINDISDEMRIEVARARWIPLEDAPKLLEYRGEKQMAKKAIEYVASHTEL